MSFETETSESGTYAKNDEKMVLEHAVAALYNSGFAGPVAGVSF